MVKSYMGYGFVRSENQPVNLGPLRTNLVPRQIAIQGTPRSSFCTEILGPQTEDLSDSLLSVAPRYLHGTGR
jgi:hypothetical protein